MFRDDNLSSFSAPSLLEILPDFINQPQPNNNSLDDIFGSSPSSPADPSFPGHVDNVKNEPSDIPRLRAEHSTSGYRDGVNAAKNSTIQEGFDEGFSLGAIIGLEVGVLLGTLEGIFTAAQKMDNNMEAEKISTKISLEKARQELKTEEVFGTKWWGEDGIWKFRVDGDFGVNHGEVTFKEVAASHPMIRKWKAIVKDEAEKWRLDLGIMDREDVARLGQHDN